MLVTLERHAPIMIPPIEELAPANDTDAAAKYFEKMGFATLLKRLLFPETEKRSEAETKENILPRRRRRFFESVARRREGHVIIERY